MDWDQILQAFRLPQRGYPVEAARAILDNPVLYQRTVDEFQRISTLPQEFEDSMFHLHVMHLLAEKRESRAFRPLLNISSLTNDQLDAALGDFLTESFKRCVAAVCDDEAAIRAFIEDRRHSEWARLVLVEALTLPVFAGDKEAMPLLAWLVDTGGKNAGLAGSATRFDQYGCRNIGDGWTGRRRRGNLRAETSADTQAPVGYGLARSANRQLELV